MRFILISLFSLILINVTSQNLVLNPSFEDITNCPMGPSELANANHWTDPFVNIVGDTCSTSDLYHACNPLGSMGVGVPANILGTQAAHTGEAYGGIIVYEAMASPNSCTPIPGTSTGWREYLQGELSSPLISGHIYCVSFYVSLADEVKWASNNFGVHFSNTQLAINCGTVGSNSDLISQGIHPQLVYSGPAVTNTTGWTKLQWTYTATGGESYIIIGNFEGNSNTNYECSDANAFNPYSYYYIDDVSVIPDSCFTLNLNVCAETNGDITVSNGIAPYTWSEYVPASSNPITNQAECQACGYTWFSGTCLQGITPVTTCNVPEHWADFATGATVTPTTNYPIQVTDAHGNSLTINDFSSLDQCTPCPPIDVTISNIANAACIGGSDGSFTASASGGTAPYNYTLTLGGTTVANFSNVTGTQDFTGLAAGNYVLNVTDASGCQGTANITVGEDNFSVAATSNSPVCEGQTISFTASGGSVYTWAGPNGYSSNAQNPSIPNASPADGGTYSVTISSPPCVDSVSFTVVVNPNPIADAGLDQTISYGESIQLDGAGGGTYAWYPTATLNNPNIQNPVATPTATTTYILTVTNTYNCSDTASVTITVEHILGDIFVPNIFSPNSSNHDNSMVYVYGPNIKEMQFFIYNRWGEKVFESNKQSHGWDGTYKGKPANPGVFTYYLEVIFLDDTEETLSGNITLVR